MIRLILKQKLNTIDLEFKDRIVLLIDDSIVRGNTSKQIIQMAREAGAKKVLFASAAPPVKYQNLYGIELTIINEESYHRDVRVIELNDKNGLIGKIYLDVYARENKRGGAWMSDYQGLYKDSIPIAFVVCNLNSPSENKPALFDFDEIVTIFHEFGHALHHLSLIHI